MTGNILKQMEHIVENDTLLELTDQEYESIKHIEEAIARDGLDGANPLKQNLYFTKLMHMPTSDEQMEPRATTAAQRRAHSKDLSHGPYQILQAHRRRRCHGRRNGHLR